jgi:BirA family biotin operon repressor/biotin-[acetyl-CoA-carboxylase] ligase
VKILFFDEVDSTQLYLKRELVAKRVTSDIAIVAKKQTSGIGSRDNSWEGMDGNLFLSFALSLDTLPKDLPLASASLYFSYLLLETVREYGSKIWLKWPNDLYIEKRKCGGMITHIVEKNIVCGVGLNLVRSSGEFGVLDVTLSKMDLLEKYFLKIEKKVSWKQVFSKYKLEFHKNNEFFTHRNGEEIALKNAILEDDGSLTVNGERIYSLR